VVHENRHSIYTGIPGLSFLPCFTLLVSCSHSDSLSLSIQPLLFPSIIQQPPYPKDFRPSSVPWDLSELYAITTTT
jgi:hypothetical protein